MVDQWFRDRGRELQHFRFQDFPPEISTRILVFSTGASSASRWRTYQALIVVSRRMQALAYDACLPHLPVMLHTYAHFDSFCMMLESNPTSVGPRIRELWLVAGIKAHVERTLGQNILQKCTRITRLACNINLLRVLVQSATFAHQSLKDLTLIEPIIPWDELLCLPNGCQFFSQLTHFRSSGGTKFIIPQFCFESLTHLSFSCHELLSGTISASPFDSTRFPALQQIVPTMPYMACRVQDPKALGAAGQMIDCRINVVACPKKWKEVDVWKSFMYGEEDLWTRARTGELLKKSRAFTTELPRWDYDDDLDGHGYGGETGL